MNIKCNVKMGNHCMRFISSV